MNTEEISRGFTLIELLIAIAIISVAIVPIFLALSAAQRHTPASGYEIAAAYYSQELMCQIRLLEPFLEQLYFQRALTLKLLLEDPQLAIALCDTSNNEEPSSFKLGGTDIRLVFSPLESGFEGREIRVSEIDSDDLPILCHHRLWNVTITVYWRLSPSDKTASSMDFSFFVREKQ